MVATVADLLRSAHVILNNGNPNVILCERGIRTFETAMRNTFDAAGIAFLKQVTHHPVIADPSHAAGHHDLAQALTACSSRCTPIPTRHGAMASSRWTSRNSTP